jgi:signal transduction histidine kinase
MILCLVIILACFACYVVVAQRRIAALKRDREKASAHEYVCGVDNERARVGMELHDGIANDLLALEIKLSSLSESDYGWIAREVAAVRNGVRNVSHELIPPEFARLGLDDVLSYYVANLSRQSKITITLTTDGSFGVGDVRDAVALTVYRIIQELLSNILKHSCASSVIIDIRSLTPKVANISITDDGIESPGNIVGLGLGIKTVADRLMSIDAKFEYKRFTNQNIKRITFEK